MRLFSFFATPCACAIAADGLGRTHIVRDPGIGIDFCPPRCGAKDGSRNAAALSEGAVFSLAGLALRMRRTVQDEDTTIQFFHDAPHLRHRGGLNWLGRCTLCDALESWLVSFRGAAALKMGAETLPYSQKVRVLPLQVLPRACAGLRHRGGLAGVGRAHIVRDAGIGIGFFPPHCGVEDKSRNAAARPRPLTSMEVPSSVRLFSCPAGRFAALPAA